ncbi:hypothetical protein ACFQZ4_10150 [Catellatospora coxensis]|uniref:Transmembrane protein n=1 Tax=Catellatospora coxensis TaxID=310354 RepID=A0A8J3PBF5_9ACTN|nr:hypothetical protein [Catellatospora coxensis]GIG11281.1 hypothetical protein Cco03nite_79810 [Catellatospora coxensis]
MTEQIRPDEAAQALTRIREQQEHVVDTLSIPDWYWWLLGGLVLGFTAAVESANPTVIGVGVTVFVLGLVAGTAWAVRGSLRARLSNALLGPRGIGLVLGFVALTVAVSLGLAFGLQAAAIGHPATWGTLAAAVLLVVGGPLLTRALRHIMLARGSR